MLKIIYAVLFSMFFSGCVPPEENEALPEEAQGLRPIYVTEQEALDIRTEPPRPIKRLGKIYYKDAKIYVNESNFGVHIIDNSDPSNPIKIKFLKIPGCRDVAIKGNYMYADNAGDLVTIDISDLDNPEVVNRIKGVQGFISQDFPEFYEGFFECIEESRGIIISWEEALLVEPECWR